MPQKEIKPDEPLSTKIPELEEFEGLERASKRHLIIFALALLFILLAGSAALYRYIQRHDQAKSRMVGVPQPMTIRSVSQYGESFFLRPFRINLAGPGQSYLQIEIVIEHQKSDVLRKELERREPQLREIVLFTVQRKDREFFLSPHGKEALRDELRIAINRVMRRKIDQIHIPALFVHARRSETGMRI